MEFIERKFNYDECIETIKSFEGQDETRDKMTKDKFMRNLVGGLPINLQQEVVVTLATLALEINKNSEDAS